MYNQGQINLILTMYYSQYIRIDHWMINYSYCNIFLSASPKHWQNILLNHRRNVVGTAETTYSLHLKMLVFNFSFNLPPIILLHTTNWKKIVQCKQRLNIGNSIATDTFAITLKEKVLANLYTKPGVVKQERKNLGPRIRKSETI